MASAAGVAEVIRFLQDKLGAKEVVVGELEAAEVIQVSDPFGFGVEF